MEGRERIHFFDALNMRWLWESMLGGDEGFFMVQEPASIFFQTILNFITSPF
jgi:hypothetical protein